MNNKDRSINDSTQTSLEEDVANSRRDFLKKTGKFAIYTPPAMMMLMKPSYAHMNSSVVGRPIKQKAVKKKQKAVKKKRIMKRRIMKRRIMKKRVAKKRVR